jgi:hypothetical protein
MRLSSVRGGYCKIDTLADESREYSGGSFVFGRQRKRGDTPAVPTFSSVQTEEFDRHPACLGAALSWIPPPSTGRVDEQA